MTRTLPLLIASFAALSLQAAPVDRPIRSGADACRATRPASADSRPRGAQAATSDYDVLSYTIDVTPDFNARTIAARCDVGLASLVSGLSSFALDLEGLTVTSVMEGVMPVAFSQAGGELVITPATPLSLAEQRTYAITYGGAPQAGMYWSSSVQEIGFTFSEPEDARYWFPCHDAPADKADWYRGRVTIPAAYLAASNGDLQSVTNNGNGTTTWEYFHDKPISTYLISLAISGYQTFTQTGPGGLPLQYFVYPSHYTEAVYDWQNVPDMIDFYSTSYFPFGFASYGMAVAPLGGAMEHQTMTSIDPRLITGTRAYEGVVAHELAHQWWGDLVTCGDWRDIWLNEGFATYFDALYTEHAYGVDAFRAQMADNRLTYFDWESYEGRFPIYDPSYMWGGTVYEKGSWILHMLRNVVGDQPFKDIMREWATRHAYGSAITTDFITVAEDVTGTQLDWFFDEWVLKAGYPEYLVRSSYAAGIATVRIDQVQQLTAQTPLYDMPLDIRVVTAAGDVTATVRMHLQSQAFLIPVPATPSRVVLDPDMKVLFKAVGTDGIVVGAGPEAANPSLVGTFTAYGAALGPSITAYAANRYGAKVGAANVDMDGPDELLSGAGPGAVFGPQARAFDVDGTAIAKINFYAYGTLRYGVNVAGAGLDADPWDEILTGPGPGAVFGPHVRAFQYDGAGPLAAMAGISFYAYGTLRYGANVAGPTIDADGYDEMVTGAGPGAVFGPHVRAFDFDGGPPVVPAPGASFFAFTTPQWGVNVAGGELDADGRDEILAGTGPGSTYTNRVRAFDYTGTAVTPIATINVVPIGSLYGAQVAAADLDGDRLSDLIVAPGPDPSVPSIVVFMGFDLAGLPRFGWAFEAFPGTTHGAHVAGGHMAD